MPTLVIVDGLLPSIVNVPVIDQNLPNWRLLKLGRATHWQVARRPED
jgi:hypothetical protein